MSITFYPLRDSVGTVNYEERFKNPEMDKRRLAVVLSPNIRSGIKLVAVVPPGLSRPDKVLPFYKEIDIPLELPSKWGQKNR